MQLSESERFSEFSFGVSVRGKVWEWFSIVLETREKLHKFFHSFKFLWFYQHHFYSNTKKVSFKYLNYVLKLSVFVFIFSRETFLSIFFFAVVYFSLKVFKALKWFFLYGWVFLRCSLEDLRCGEKQSVGERVRLRAQNGQMGWSIF